MGTAQRREAALAEVRAARDEVRTIKLELDEAQTYLIEAAWAACSVGVSWSDIASTLDDTPGALRHDIVRHG